MPGAGPEDAGPAELDSPGGCRLYRYAGRDEPRRTVVVAHGMFSGARDLRRLSAHLAAAGHDVWAFDFRGHGASAPLADDEDFEAAALRDVDDVLDEIARHVGAGPITWVGHSGGGLAVLMHLVRRPAAHARIERLVLVASQATRAGAGAANRARLLGIVAGLLVLRRVEGRRFGVGPGSETRAVLRQWCRWNLRGRWTGHDGLDYLDGLRDVRVPTLVLSGAGDKFIAPPAGCEALHHHLGGDDTRYVECGPRTGFETAYGHAGLLCSRAASREVWPMILEWIERGSDVAHAPALRAAVPADVPPLRAIARRAYARYVPRIGREPAPMSADYASLVDDGVVRVLDSGNAVLGYVVAYPDGEALHLENVAVDPAHAGRGHGRRLVAQAETQARELGLQRVELYTNARMLENIAMYAHLGYAETGRRREHGYERVYFAKEMAL